MGVLEILQWAIAKNYQSVIIDSDVKRAFEVISSTEPDKLTFGDFVAANRRILVDHPGFSIRWINRNANLVAHSLARAACYFSDSYY